VIALLFAMALSTPGRVVDFPVARAYVPFLQPARYKGAYGGRGSAKSHEFAKNVLKRCIEKPGTRVVCVREIQRTLEQSVKRLLEDKIEAFNVKDQFSISNTQISTPSGGVIIFQGMQDHTADSIKSLEGFDVAWVEEAQTVSERSLTLLRPTIREPGSELWFTWNPRHKTDPVDKFLRGAEIPPGSIVVGTTFKDNPWFPDVLRKEMEWDRSRDPEKYAHVWLGEYEKHSEARVFKNWRVASTAEDFEALDNPPADTVHYYGADWGYSIDPSVLVRCHLAGKTLYIDREAYAVGVEINDLPALFDQVSGAREWPITADSARPETISYMRNHGFPRLQAAAKGKDSVKEGIIFLQGYDIVVHPRCAATHRELTNYRFKTDSKAVDEDGQPLVLPVLEDKENHVIDSLRYAVESLRRPSADDWLVA
jgi:phage terminase large subunit